MKSYRFSWLRFAFASDCHPKVWVGQGIFAKVCILSPMLRLQSQVMSILKRFIKITVLILSIPSQLQLDSLSL